MLKITGIPASEVHEACVAGEWRMFHVDSSDCQDSSPKVLARTCRGCSCLRPILTGTLHPPRQHALESATDPGTCLDCVFSATASNILKHVNDIG